MSPSAVLSSTDPARRFEGSIAGKVFILGEYAVLGGQPALLAAVGPRFELRARVRAGADTPAGGAPAPATGAGARPGRAWEPWSPRPESPAGRLSAWARANGCPDLELEWRDLRAGVGGFGGSTAEFALAYRAWLGARGGGSARGGGRVSRGEAEAAAAEGGWLAAWRLYRELTADAAGVPPSGSDLVAQWRGGVTLFDPSRAECVDLWAAFPWDSLLVFSASHQSGRKVATHGHLAGLGATGFFGGASPLVAELGAVLARGLESARAGDAAGLGRALGAYADVLARAGLEHEATAADRAALAGLPGILGVKGAGAMQADALVALVSPPPGSRERRRILEAALGHGLALVADGLRPEEGISCASVS